MRFIYLDNNASTQVHPEVAQAMREWTEGSLSYGNPHAGHFLGERSRIAIANARSQVCSIFGIYEGWRCIFTSGATESINFALKGTMFRLLKARWNQSSAIVYVLTSPVEHSAVDKCLEWLVDLFGPGSVHIEKMHVDSHGVIDTVKLKETLSKRQEGFDLVTCIHTVAETGAVQPIEEISHMVKSKFPSVIFHCDASQSVGKLRNELVRSLARSCDLITVAGHKFHAPKGVGALLIKSCVDIDPLIHGAGQEYGLRGGTENVAYIVGLGKACEIAQKEGIPTSPEAIQKSWDKFEAHLAAAGINFRLNSTAPERSPFTINFSIDGFHGPNLVKGLGNRGQENICVCFSAGSACHSRGGPSPSKVLQAMGVEPRYSVSGIRLSLGKLSTEAELDEGLHALASYIVNSLER